MEYYHIHYPKYDVRFTGYDIYSYLTTTFKYKNKSYVINKRTSKRNIARNTRLVNDLKNKDSVLYSELLIAIDEFNNGKSIHVAPKEISKEILKTYDIRYRGYFRIKLHSNKFYYDWDFECLIELEKNQFPVIYIEC